MPSREPGLEGLDRFVGEWDTEGQHVQLEGTITGHASVEWLRGRRFLIWRTHNPPETVPSSISIIGGGDQPGVWPMHYFDERGVYRVYQLSVRADGFVLWRDEPGFRQRGSGTFDESGSAMRVLFELNRDGTFQRDLEITYRRRGPKTK